MMTRGQKEKKKKR